jgi:hypothetical protein
VKQNEARRKPSQHLLGGFFVGGIAESRWLMMKVADKRKQNRRELLTKGVKALVGDNEKSNGENR